MWSNHGLGILIPKITHLTFFYLRLFWHVRLGGSQGGNKQIFYFDHLSSQQFSSER